MAIYRGSGGAGDATGDATNASQLALAAADEAQASATSAASSATSAANSASAAAADAADAATSETNAAGSASDALASENAAASSASDAADSAAAAATSATNAAASASTASTQATNASNSASSASTSATNAANSATSASTSATNASNSASAAATSETNAGNSATAAATSATNAAASASTASTQASNASTSATNAASSATAASSSASSASSSASAASTSSTNAASSASSASSSASSASTSATNASNSASAAATSATNAANSATAAAASAAEAATFDPDLYLSKAGNLSGLANTVTAANNIGINPYGNGFKNRIINGAMMIDQRNNGASVTQGTSYTYVMDRFAIRGTVTSKFTGRRSTTAPAGFVNSLLCTSSSAYSVGAAEAFFAGQVIEGFNCADLGWGTANAATVTLSFWVRSSLTGTFGGSLCNYAGDRSYPFTYAISAANTWEQKSVTIAGDQSGTWPTDSGGGIVLNIGLGAGSTLSGTAGAWAGALYRSATGATSVVGTSGATFYITGVQLEKGSTATSFDYRPYGTELALCQRYYQAASIQMSASTDTWYSIWYYKVSMRATPTLAGGGAGFTTSFNTTENFIGYQTARTTGQALTASAEL